MSLEGTLGKTTVAPARPARTLGCHGCGTLQCLPAGADRHEVLHCAVCDATLVDEQGRNLTAALAFAAAGLLLLVAAHLQPFLGTSIFGVSRRSWLVSSPLAMWRSGYPELGAAIGLFLVLLPLLRLGALTAVLGVLHTRRRPRWLGPTFRLANALQTWAMVDVFLVGSVVAWARLRTELSVQIGPGAWCFGAAALATLLVRATLSVDAAWQAIAPARVPAGPAEGLVCCGACQLLMPAQAEGSACPRCRGPLRARKPFAVARAAALAFAAALLYLPANFYAMATLPIGFTPTKYTVLEGVVDLLDARLYALGVLVLLASFAIPLGKLLGLGWCVSSVLLRSTRHLRLKTRVFEIIEEIGRWSMVDPFVIACFVPITQFNTLVYGRAGPAAPAFAAVVILTTLAAHCFDPRLMWDAARLRKPP